MSRPLRVLHVVRAMKRAGVETWLMHVLRRRDPRRLTVDLLVHTDECCDYDEEIGALGCRMFRICEPTHSLAYGRAVMSLLHDRSYDAVHSHVHHFSGYLLTLAKAVGVPLRIAHSHSDTSCLDHSAGWLRRIYLSAMGRLLRRNANRLVGVSGKAGESLFGPTWLSDSRSRLLYCGVDLAPYHSLPTRREARSEWGIGDRELVVGHVGRFQAPKNHAFLVEIAAQIARREPHTRVLLVGDGPLRQAVAEKTRTLGIDSQVIYTGVRQDVPRLLAAMDVFLFPSSHEGLPLSLVEAQAAGLPCVISDRIAEEADVNSVLVERHSLGESACQWADAVLRAGERRRPEQRRCLGAIAGGNFDIDQAMERLYALYGA